MVETTPGAQRAQGSPRSSRLTTVLGVAGLVVVIGLLMYPTVTARGKQLGRWELRGNPKDGFSGDMPYPPATEHVHLYYDAVWVGSKSPPEGKLDLQLLRGGEVIDAARCSTDEDKGPGICGHSGGGKELGSAWKDCEHRVACAFTKAIGNEPLTLRARLTFAEPERFRELARYQIVLRESWRLGEREDAKSATLR